MKLVADARVLGSKPCGIGMYAYHYLEELKRSAEVELVLLTDVAESREIREMESSGVPVVVYGKPVFRSAAVLGYFRFIGRELRKRQPDVFWEPNCLIPAGLPGYRGKLAVTIYDMFPLTMPDCFGWKYRQYFRYGVKRTIGRADLICYDSFEAQRCTEAFFPEAKKKNEYVCYPIVERIGQSGADQENVPQKVKNTQEPAANAEPYFFYVGNVERRKGIDILLRAYLLYRKEGGRKELKIAGGFKDESLRDLLDRMKSVEGFSYLGYVSETEKKRLYQHCDTFVFPSRGEGFGIPVLEAMAAGKPVIASRLSVFEEVIGGCIQYFDLEGSEEDQAEALCRAMRHDLDADISAYEHVLARYDKGKLGEAFSDRLQRLCDENQPGTC